MRINLVSIIPLFDIEGGRSGAPDLMNGPVQTGLVTEARLIAARSALVEVLIQNSSH